MWKFLLAVTIAVVVAGCSQEAQEKPDIVYRAVANENILVIKPASKTISNGHIAQPMSLCNDTYVCLRSPWITLSVPKPLVPKTTWKLDDWTYTVIPEGAVDQGNPESAIYRIRALQKNVTVDYWFSFANGVQAIEIQSSGEKALYKLVGTCGFGGAACNRNAK
jgi:hypothetical protein